MNLSGKPYSVLFLLIFVLSGFLLSYRLSTLMMFIGDFGWFYISARDMVLTGNIPLVGIASSHPWLHQGPLWTYLLAAGLAFSHFHPLSGGLIAILFGLGSVFLVYKIGKEFFSETVGLVVALFFACSPLVIIHARMPYHTAPIPFFTCVLLYAVYQVVKGKPYYFPVVLCSLSILYNLELASIVYWFAVVLLIGWGIVKKQKWIGGIKNPRIILLSLIAWILPLMPILIYDVGHGFPQTIKYAAWMGYKVLTIIGYPSLHEEISPTSNGSLFSFFGEQIKKLFFLPNQIVAIGLFLSGVGYVIYRTIVSYRAKNLHASLAILALFLATGLGGFFAAKTTSEAYLPMLFPTLILSLALLTSLLLSISRIRIFIVLVGLLMIYGNVFSLLHLNYLMTEPRGYGPKFSQRLAVADLIVKEAGKKNYTIKGAGPGSQFDSYTMNYEYLTWWKGHGPDKKQAVMQFVITDTPSKILVNKELRK